MGTYLKIFRVIFLIVGIAALVEALVTGRIRIKGGRWIATKSVLNNPILRSEFPRDYWFIFCLMTIIFVILCWAFFRMS